MTVVDRSTGKVVARDAEPASLVDWTWSSARRRRRASTPGRSPRRASGSRPGRSARAAPPPPAPLSADEPRRHAVGDHARAGRHRRRRDRRFTLGGAGARDGAGRSTRAVRAARHAARRAAAGGQRTHSCGAQRRLPDGRYRLAVTATRRDEERDEGRRRRRRPDARRARRLARGDLAERRRGRRRADALVRADPDRAGAASTSSRRASVVATLFQAQLGARPAHDRLGRHGDGAPLPDGVHRRGDRDRRARRRPAAAAARRSTRRRRC